MCSRATRAGGRCGLAEVLVLMIVDHISLFIPGEVQLFLLLKCMMQERFNVTYYYLRCSTELGTTYIWGGRSLSSTGGSSSVAVTEVVICFFVDSQYSFKNFQMSSFGSIFCYFWETPFLVFSRCWLM